jgi:alanine dehydrogenase
MSMVIGIPREIKPDENRVAITPAGVHEYITSGHSVIIEKGAGAGSGIADDAYTAEGARILPTAREIFDNAEMIIKVKEPLPDEIGMLKKDQVLYTFLHLAPNRELTTGLAEKSVIAIAYETISAGGKLVCLEPMSEIAGKMSAIMGSFYLSKPHGGKGVLAGGVAGVHSGNFLVLGGGTAGRNAARVAAGLGARVVVMDIDIERMRYLEDVLPKNCETIMSNRINIEYEISTADVIIGAVLIPGAKAPRLITREMLSRMQPGTVIIDISIDQGGCIETSRPTTHSRPVYEVDGIVHYCVANMPGAFPRSSTFALVNATHPFGLMIANRGWKQAARESASIRGGINIAQGEIVCQPVAEAHNLKYTPLDDMLT